MRRTNARLWPERESLGARRMRELGRRLKRRRRGERWPEFVWVAGECRVAFSFVEFV